MFRKINHLICLELWVLHIDLECRLNKDYDPLRVLLTLVRIINRHACLDPVPIYVLDEIALWVIQTMILFGKN